LGPSAFSPAELPASALADLTRAVHAARRIAFGPGSPARDAYTLLPRPKSSSACSLRPLWGSSARSRCRRGFAEDEHRGDGLVDYCVRPTRSDPIVSADPKGRRRQQRQCFSLIRELPAATEKSWWGEGASVGARNTTGKVHEL